MNHTVVVTVIMKGSTAEMARTLAGNLKMVIDEIAWEDSEVEGKHCDEVKIETSAFVGSYGMNEIHKHIQSSIDREN